MQSDDDENVENTHNDDQLQQDKAYKLMKQTQLLAPMTDILSNPHYLMCMVAACRVEEVILFLKLCKHTTDVELLCSNTELLVDVCVNLCDTLFSGNWLIQHNIASPEIVDEMFDVFGANYISMLHFVMYIYEDRIWDIYKSKIVMRLVHEDEFMSIRHGAQQMHDDFPINVYNDDPHFQEMLLNFFQKAMSEEMRDELMQRVEKADEQQNNEMREVENDEYFFSGRYGDAQEVVDENDNEYPEYVSNALQNGIAMDGEIEVPLVLKKWKYYPVDRYTKFGYNFLSNNVYSDTLDFMPPVSKYFGARILLCNIVSENGETNTASTESIPIMIMHSLIDYNMHSKNYALAMVHRKRMFEEYVREESSQSENCTSENELNAIRKNIVDAGLRMVSETDYERERIERLNTFYYRLLDTRRMLLNEYTRRIAAAFTNYQQMIDITQSMLNECNVRKTNDAAQVERFMLDYILYSRNLKNLYKCMCFIRQQLDVVRMMKDELLFIAELLSKTKGVDVNNIIFPEQDSLTVASIPEYTDMLFSVYDDSIIHDKAALIDFMAVNGYNVFSADNEAVIAQETSDEEYDKNKILADNADTLDAFAPYIISANFKNICAQFMEERRIQHREKLEKLYDECVCIIQSEREHERATLHVLAKTRKENSAVLDMCSAEYVTHVVKQGLFIDDDKYDMQNTLHASNTRGIAQQQQQQRYAKDVLHDVTHNIIYADDAQSDEEECEDDLDARVLNNSMDIYSIARDVYSDIAAQNAHDDLDDDDDDEYDAADVAENAQSSENADEVPVHMRVDEAYTYNMQQSAQYDDQQQSEQQQDAYDGNDDEFFV